MRIETLIDEATFTLAQIDGGDSIMHIALPRLKSFLAYLDSANVVPEHLCDTPISAFPDFVADLEQRGIPDDELHLVLASVRMILTLRGLKPKDLESLTAPRKRERTKNQDGKSRFVLKKIAPNSDPE